MSKRSRKRAAPAPATPPPPPPAASADSGARGRAPWHGRARWIVAVVALLVAVAGIAWWFAQRSDGSAARAPGAASTAKYVGESACASCHAAEQTAWQGSHHELAMQVADEKSVLGNFANARFTHAGVTSRFFRRDGRFWVNTDGPDGKLRDFEIKYTFGVTPLQQYLIELPGGRLQAFGVAWDSRPKAQGGQRWFHLYPDRRLRAGDPLHWTGIDQNWNFQCADCHSTNLRKNYDEKTGTFDTRWAAINVGCQACHGPGSDHVAWAKKEGAWKRFGGPGKGLAVALDERRGVTWPMNASTGTAMRSKPRESMRELETCARCHARRGQFSDDWHPGRALGDAFNASPLGPGLYHVDGQQRDEVYNFASFLQSRMHAKGVTCSDCHEPHSLKLRAPGNAACAQCHAPAKYDAAAHHRHRVGSKGAECAACHMPTTTYMVVDPRHDHSMRIPRPDLSISLGVPNACSQCHTKETPKWAAETIRKWYGRTPIGYQQFAEIFRAAELGAPGAHGDLLRLAEDRGQPPIVRASALARLERFPGPLTVETAKRALNDDDALVREAAVRVLAPADVVARVQLLPRMLEDPVRAVRMDAARALAGPAVQRLNEAQRAALGRALDEYVAAQRFNADRPESHMNLGNLYAQIGDATRAQAAYEKALALDPSFVQGYVNLSDLQRARGMEGQAEATLRKGLVRDPRSAELRHALGLSLVRQKRLPEAVRELGEASRLGPNSARYSYVYAVGLNESGQRAQAIRVLEAAIAKNPYDRELLLAGSTYQRAAGNIPRALEHARRLREVDPENAEAARLVADTENAVPKAQSR